MKLITPSLEHLDSYIECLKRGWNPISLDESQVPFEREISEINADSTKFLKKVLNFTGLGDRLNLEDGTTAERLPSFTRWMWDGEICGRIQFRWQSNTVELPPFCLGHIGYGVAQWKRKRGYATLALKFLIEEIKYCGLPYVELTTSQDNLSSQKVIFANGGEFVEDFKKLEMHGGAMGKRFRIYLT